MDGVKDSEASSKLFDQFAGPMGVTISRRQSRAHRCMAVGVLNRYVKHALLELARHSRDASMAELPDAPHSRSSLVVGLTVQPALTDECSGKGADKGASGRGGQRRSPI